MRGRRLALLLASGVLAVVIVVWHVGREADFVLPPEMPIDTVVSELTGPLVAAAGPPVRRAPLAPREGLLVRSGPRDAVVVPPRARLAARVAVPAGALLEFSVGVESEGRKRPDAAGIGFAVDVDGRRRFARLVNPLARYDDRVWFDEVIDLSADAGREVELVFVTEVVGGGRVAGTPGWSQPRLVQRRWQPRAPAAPGAPNVLVLLVDTLRADRLGCYGGPAEASPVLDGLARTGTLFTQHVAQAPWTLPSTASVLTGLYPPAHGAPGDGPQTLPGELTTLAEAAEAAGITTVGVSTNPLISRGTNFAQGFETFVELEIETGKERGEVVKSPAGAAAVNAAFVRWLARNRGHRFLAYLHYMEPHDPYTPPAHLRPPPPAGIRPSLAAGRLDPWRQQLRSAEGLRLSDAELGYLRRLYDAEIRAWDEELGRLLERLEALDVRRSTVIVVTADHGEEFGEHGRLTHGFHLYDELIRVPLVVGGPGIPGGRRVDLQTMGIDVFPTVAALLGLSVPDGLPGRNVLELTEARPAFAMTLSGRLPDGTGTEIVAVRTPAAKLIWAPERGAYQLFDLARDPGEAANRWGDAAGGAGLAQVLAGWRAQAPAAPRGAADPAFEERLRALGYVE